MKICIVIPVKKGSLRGNEITANRWAGLLREAGHEVSVCSNNDPVSCDADCLIGIHAIGSYEFVKRFRESNPTLPILVCLSGTDLHGVFDESPDKLKEPLTPERQTAEQCLDLANRIILLEPMGARKLPRRFQAKCRVVFQSAEKTPKSDKPPDHFLVSVIGHLRTPKDPMLTAKAGRLLPPESRIQVVHVGDIIEKKYEQLVETECLENPRYRWVGKLPFAQAQQILVQSHLTVLSSIHEGAPSIVSETIVNEIPLLATRIDATLGMLGADYPGLFPVGDYLQLAKLMTLAEKDESFRSKLLAGIRAVSVQFTREREQECLEQLLSF